MIYSENKIIIGYFLCVGVILRVFLGLFYVSIIRFYEGRVVFYIVGETIRLGFRVISVRVASWIVRF